MVTCFDFKTIFKMNNPKICVVVPVYKVEKYLRECVDSILNQTFTEFQVILVDLMHVARFAMIMQRKIIE